MENFLLFPNFLYYDESLTVPIYLFIGVIYVWYTSYFNNTLLT